METTGADANDEFARWLAETAKAGQAADQATSAQPGAPAAPPPAAAPVQPSGAIPPPPSAGQPSPPSPEFFGADQLASPPTRPYEAPFAGPQIARTSFQPAAGDPPLPPVAAPPAAPPPAVPPPSAAPPPAAPPPSTPVPPAGSIPPAAGAQAPPAAPPTWAPGYAGPAAEAPPPAAPAAPAEPQLSPPPAQSTPFFPAGDSAPVGFPAPPVSPAAPAFPPLDTPPAFGSDPGAPGAPLPPSFPPVAPEPPAAPVPPPTPDAPSVPSYEAPFAQPAPVPPGPPASPGSDPFGPLFATEASDTAARLAASPPPAADAPPLPSPPVGERPADEDALSSLFGGLETAEAPVAPTADLFESTPVAPAAPVYTPEPAFTVEPVLPPAPPSEPDPAPAPTAAAPGAGYTQAFSPTPPSGDDPLAGTQFFGGGSGDYEEPPDLDRTTAGEKIAFALAFLIPPAGLIGSIVAAAQSARRRGWVHRLVKAGLVISIVTTIAAGIGGAYGYKVLEDQRRHDSLVRASAQFCSTIAEQPDMVEPPTFGFPGPGASIPETIAGIQAYIDRWDALADKSPSGIRPDVTRVADAARDILSTIETTRLVNNEQNIANMTSVAESTQILSWQTDYC